MPTRWPRLPWPAGYGLPCALLLLLLLAGTCAQAGRAVPAPAAVAVTPEPQNSITVLPDTDYHTALLEGIRMAKREIRAAYYLVNPSDSKNNRPTRILLELISAQKRGVDVAVLLEYSGHNKELNQSNGKAAALLSENGVTVSFDSPRATTHTKLMVIDRRLCFIGSHNLTQAALTRSNELSLRIDSPELADQLLRYIEGIQ